jgi:site-specific recombinase XerD
MKRESVATVTSSQLFSSPPQLTESVARFFNEHIRNAHTRRTYLRAARYFAEWCERRGVAHAAGLYALHFNVYFANLNDRFSSVTVTQHRSALNRLFFWLVKEGLLEGSPVSAAPGPQCIVDRIKTPVVTTRHIRLLLNSITLVSPKDYRDRALIGVVVYCFTRIKTALEMRVGDFFNRDGFAWVRLQGRNGLPPHELPCHSELRLFLEEYIAVAGIMHDASGVLFRGGAGYGTYLKESRMALKTAYGMFHRRAREAGIEAGMGAGILRATAISSYLENGGRLQAAQWIANHKNPDTTLKYRLNGPVDAD